MRLHSTLSNKCKPIAVIPARKALPLRCAKPDALRAKFVKEMETIVGQAPNWPTKGRRFTHFTPPPQSHVRRMKVNSGKNKAHFEGQAFIGWKFVGENKICLFLAAELYFAHYPPEIANKICTDAIEALENALPQDHERMDLDQSVGEFDEARVIVKMYDICYEKDLPVESFNIEFFATHAKRFKKAVDVLFNSTKQPGSNGSDDAGSKAKKKK